MLSYLARYGQQGLLAQTQGVHAYFPSILRLSLGIAGGALLITWLMIAGGRLLLGKSLGLRATGRVPVVNFFLVLVSCQLVMYIVQEMAETVTAHAPLTFSAVGLIAAWGVIAQVPIALAAAVALSWISVRLELVIAGMRSALRRLAQLGTPRPVAALQALVPAESTLALKLWDSHSLSNRGPPSLLQVLS